MKRYFPVVLLVILGLLFTACAPATPQVVEVEKIIEKPVIQTVIVEKEVPVEKEVVKTVVIEKVVTPTPSELERPVELVQWVFPRYKNVVGYAERTREYGDFEKILAEKFHELHPNVTIKTEVIPWEGGPAKVDAAIAAGEPPDVFHDYFGRSPKWWKMGVLEPLEDSIDAETKADYKESYYNAYIIDGHLHAFPTNSWIVFMVANKTLADAAGVGDKLPTLDDPTWTLDEFMEVCRAVNDPPNQYCFGVFAGEHQGVDYSYLPWFWAHGARLLNDARDKVIINSPEGVEALQALVDMQKEGLIVPGAAGLKGTELQQLFVQKRVVFMPWSNAAWTAVSDAIKDGVTEPPFEVVGMSFPSKDGSPVPLPAGTTGTMVFKQDDPIKRYWAIEYAKFFNSAENMAAICATSGRFAARKSVGDIFKGRPEMAIGNKLLEIAPQGDFGLGLPAYGEIRKLWMVALQEALTGVKTPQQALDDFAAAANELL